MPKQAKICLKNVRPQHTAPRATLPPGGGQEQGVMVPTFLFSIAEVFLHQMYQWDKKVMARGHVGVTKVEQSIIFFGVVFGKT